MAKVALNKSSLSREKQRRSSYRRYLPSLELKQKQLLLERKRAREALADQRAQIEQVQSNMNYYWTRDEVLWTSANW